ncbi:hypothetical protein J0H58_08325 [bacterium]|nr:hypothetical protein [bacterium]
MSRLPFAPPVLVVSLFVAAPLRGQDDLPPETKAVISKLKDEAKNKSASTRASAYKSMGELGTSGASLRRALCDGMLDPAVTVRTAAADALKKIDAPLYKSAMAIYIDKDMQAVAKAANSGSRAEPLVPLILPIVAQFSPMASQPITASTRQEQLAAINLARANLETSLRTLVAIAPDDELVNKGVISMLTNTQAGNRAVAVDLVGRVKNRKLALPTLVALAGNAREPDATRVKAVLLLPEVCDENTRPRARRTVEAVRLDSSRTVREAAETALRRLGE